MKRRASVLPTYWTPEQALAVFEILDGLRDQLWSLYGPQIQQAMREEQCATSPKPYRAVDQHDLPF
jgi:hypothetical protein